MAEGGVRPWLLGSELLVSVACPSPTFPVPQVSLSVGWAVPALPGAMSMASCWVDESGHVPWGLTWEDLRGASWVLAAEEPSVSVSQRLPLCVCSFARMVLRGRLCWIPL